MARRGENIRKRKDGRWEGRYTLPNVETGKSVVVKLFCNAYG